MSLLVCIYFFLLNYFVVYAYVVIVLGTFLVNFVLVLVLFDSDAIRSFVSVSFCRGFIIAYETLDQPLKVGIVVDPTVSTFEIYRNYVLKIFSVGFPIDLVHITMEDVHVIVGMDWQSQFGH